MSGVSAALLGSSARASLKASAASPEIFQRGVTPKTLRINTQAAAMIILTTMLTHVDDASTSTTSTFGCTICIAAAASQSNDAAYKPLSVETATGEKTTTRRARTTQN